MKYACIAIVSALLACASAFHFAEPKDLHACNVSETRICGDFFLRNPEKKEGAEGVECFNDIQGRRTFKGKSFRRVGDQFEDFYFEIFNFFKPFTMVINNNQILQIPARTIYGYEKNNSTKVTRCDKYEMPDYEQYRKPGIPNDYDCRANSVEGWVDQDRNDGVKIKLCNRAETTSRGTNYFFRSATDKDCYPIQWTEFTFNSQRKFEILEEREYFNWQSPGVMPVLPSDCWSI